jgi:protein-disulfide isomerase
MNRHFSIAAALLLAVATTGQAQQAPADFDAAIRKYIIEHPEVILESLTAHQARQKVAAQERIRQTVVAEREELVNDVSSPSVGNPKGVTIVEFFDYRCGYCKKAKDTVAQLLESNPDVRVVYKELPILGPDSMLAAKASLGAHKQGAYAKFQQALFAATEPFTMDFIVQTAAGLGLDVEKLKADMNDPAIDEAIVRNSQLADRLKIRATPTFVVGSETIAGALDLEKLKRLVEAAKPASGE